jgi:hypothetical protein
MQSIPVAGVFPTAVIQVRFMIRRPTLTGVAVWPFPRAWDCMRAHFPSFEGCCPGPPLPGEPDRFVQELRL